MNINKIQEFVEEDGIVFLSYGGFLSQELISAMTEALEKEAEHNDISMGTSNNIFTIFIELTQNMMNYSKSRREDCDDLDPTGLVVVSREDDGIYAIHSRNVISNEDKEKIEPKLKEIKTLDKDGLKKRYRELRRSGRDTHEKGGGIGFYEIAKRCDDFEYDFQEINNSKLFFYVKTTIQMKQKEKQ
ncbi:MAG: SiaB family protein kinase [Campylobacterota bacterium]|nr:SiaB family protein kinase [Campylobacterota bacterium]